MKINRPRLNSIAGRMILFFVSLLVLVQLAVFVSIDVRADQIAQKTVDHQLEVGERVFERLWTQNNTQLEQEATVLAADFGLREALASNDHGTILSVLANHATRVGAAAMIVVSLDGRVVVDSLHPAGEPRIFEYSDLLTRAQDSGHAAATVAIDGRLYQLVLVPVLAPERIAYVAIGFHVDDVLARELGDTTGLEVSFLSTPARGERAVAASTLGSDLRTELARLVPLGAPAWAGQALSLGQRQLETRVRSLSPGGSGAIDVVLQKSLDEAVEPFKRLRASFGLLAVLCVAVTITGSVLIARNITRPIRSLAQAALRIQAGDYASPVPVPHQGEIGAFAATFSHMQDAIALREGEVRRLAYRDALTDLPNRALFMNELDRAIAECGKAGQAFSVLLMDLDRFRFVNDTLGHHAGDRVIIEVAARLRSALSEQDVLARLGGDEFAVLLSPQQLESPAVASQLLQCLQVPVVVDGQSLDVGVSIGIARFPRHGTDAVTLLRRADVAMYVAKREHKGIEEYDHRIDRYRQHHLSLLSELRQAIDSNELRLHFQPKIDLRSEEARGVEALVRWIHPVRGTVPPSEFIPFAEQTGFIRHVTRWVIEAALAQIQAWHALAVEIPVAINVSARDLSGTELPDILADAMRRHQVSPRLISLEITESALMEDPQHAARVLARLRELGVGIAIDDYGTGYSALSYLSQLSVDCLKIDRSLVNNLRPETRNAAIVRSTVQLGQNLGLTIVAEGVETPDQIELLRQFGCHQAQGFGLARPMPAEEVMAWVVAHELAQHSAPGSSPEAELRVESTPTAPAVLTSRNLRLARSS
jgi:diguanylate cyclase (GGDEF)-like protein